MDEYELIQDDESDEPSTRGTSRTQRDVFVSYSSKDRAFVEKLGSDLASLGVAVWIDRLEMKVGDSLVEKISEGISESSWLAIVLSPDSVTSPWVQRELKSALSQELEKNRVYVLPILLKDCDIPLFLKDKVYADFRDSYESGLRELLSRVKPAINQKRLEYLLSGSADRARSAYSRIPEDDQPAYLQIVESKLNSPSTQERIGAMTACFAIRHKNIGAVLLRLASDASASVRRQAIFYLGELRLRMATQVVNERMSDGSPDVRAAARDAYRKITGRAS